MQITPFIKKGLRLIEEREHVIGRYYPSELSYCMRRVYANYVGKSVKYDMEARKAFAIGDAIHDLCDLCFMSYAKKYPDFKVTTEVSDLIYTVPPDITISGRLDALIGFSNETHVVEIKSHANPLRVLEPHRNHLEQLNYYLHFYPDAKGHIIYVNKSKRIYSNVDFLEFPKEGELDIKYNDAMFMQMVDKAKMIHSYLLKGEEPPPEPEMHAEFGRCPMCPFQKKYEKELADKLVNKMAKK
jgi:CRISPR/Cas system-associated exonuclease Cas4 (RecB family)